MITEEALRQALEEVDNAILASLPEPAECDHQFSRRFERKLRSVRRRARHPAAYKLLQAAACMMLVATVLFGSVMAFNPNARAAFVAWIKEQFESFSHYFYTEEPSTRERKSYELGWIPNGYTFVDEFETVSQKSLIYINESGRILYFSYHYGAQTDQVFFGLDKHKRFVVFVEKCIAEVYISPTEDSNSLIIWYDSAKDILFHIGADAGKDELIKLAKGIIESD